MVYTPAYQNDGSGRDTFINHAGAYWLNPLPGGTYHKSLHVPPPGTARTAASGVFADSIDPFASQRPSAQSVMGKSRYGTTILPAGTLGITADASEGAAAHTHPHPTNSSDPDQTNGHQHLHRDGTAAPAMGTSGYGSGSAGGEGVTFDAEATAVEKLPYDVPCPEQRLSHPGHAQTGLEATGGSTYSGHPGPWTAPREVDSTLLRIAPGYESTCHYGLRTGRFYTEDQAPPNDGTLPEKGVNWGKSRYV